MEEETVKGTVNQWLEQRHEHSARDAENRVRQRRILIKGWLFVLFLLSNKEVCRVLHRMMVGSHGETKHGGISCEPSLLPGT